MTAAVITVFASCMFVYALGYYYEIPLLYVLIAAALVGLVVGWSMS